MNFATWSIHNPLPSMLLFIMLTLAGVYGFKNLPIQNLPDIELPTAIVSVSLPGAAPAQLETEVARKVEDSIATVSGIKHISTSITDGAVSITVQFVLEKSLSDALIETKDAVDHVRADLPTDVLPPTVSAVRVGGQPLMTFTISSAKMDEEALSWFVDDTVSKTMLALSGVGKFDRVGGVNREIRIDVDPARLSSLGATAADVSRALKNVQRESSGGRAQLGALEQSVRTIGTVTRASDLEALPVTLANTRDLRLDQIATVRDTSAERTQAALLDGKPVVGFRIYRALGSDETNVAKLANEALQKLKTRHPDLEITPINNTVDYTLAQYRGSMHMLYEGAILAVIVVWFFLRDWRATLISATALPLSIIPTFAAMHWFGFSLNTLTLLAQAVVVGILVDDAIVEVENIVRHKKMGKSVLKATEEAVEEIALAVIATTFTLVVVFLPTSLMGGVSGLFFKQFGWTVVISVLASLLVARLLTPVMAVYFLKSDNHVEAPDGPIMTKYVTAVRWCMSRRKTTIGLATVFLLVCLGLATRLSSGFVPAADLGYTTISLELPPGSSISDTLAAAEKTRLAVGSVAGIEHVFSTVGVAQAGGGPQQPQAGEVRKASVMLTLKPRGERPRQREIEKAASAALASVPGARFTVGSGTGAKMSILLSSDNALALKETAHALENDLRGMGGLSNISSTATLQRPEITIRPDFARAAELGVTTADIADTVRIATAGDFDQQVAKLNLDSRQVYIRVRMPDSARQDIDAIANLRVPARGGLTALSTVADITTGTGPAQIDRYDRHRFVTIGADLGGMPLGEALDKAKKLPALANMPSSVRQIDAGDAEFMTELFSGFGIAMLTGMLCVLCVLVLLFKDFFQPVTILMALPLSFAGSILALLATNGEVGLPALIGIIMLMGIVTKNSILLVEYAIVAIRERGMSRYEALVDACHKRARPIVMTTIAMIAGMMPIALGLGGDSSFRQPMAIAVIGGLITSTALSLLVVPVTYLYIDDIETWLGRRFARFKPDMS
ncbi:MAG: efflux RND transporter permease subunit [Alphaproteobacteria bacterium]|nr:efflux RND transporter permease subunit [Alphaproteobacteria bacterium]